MIRYWDKKFWGKIVKPTSSVIPNIFRYPKPFETQKGSSTKWFGTVIQNNFDGKSWNPPPLLSMTFFDTRNLLKHRRVPLRNDSVDKTILVENRNTRPLSYPELFPIPEINETLQNSPTKIFSTVRQENFEWNPWCSPPPPHLIHELIRYRKNSETQHRRAPLRIFSMQWDIKFSIENRDIPLLGIKIFHTRNFLNYRRVPLRIDFDSVLWDETIFTENRDTRPLSYPLHFSIPETFWNTEGFLY